MKLPQIAVENPVFTVMIFVGILLFGAVSLSMLSMDVLPDIEQPQLTVITVYPGASADDVEQQVTKVLEEELTSVTNIKKITSESKENVSFIHLQFKWGLNLDSAVNATRDRIEMVKRQLPSDAQSPMIYRINSSMMPVLIYGVEAKESFGGLDKIIQNTISSHLKSITGVGTVVVVGQPEREIQVNINPYKTKSYHLTTGMIAQLISNQNITIPAGNIKIGKNDISVRVPGEFKSIQELKNITLTNFGGKTIHLYDVAEVKDTFKDKDEMMRTSGTKSVLMMIQKQSGANTLEVVNAIKKEMINIRKLVPGDVKITQQLDSSELVTHSISNLKSTIIYSGIFVVLVVFFFLREMKSSLIVILTIPFSLIVAFIFMYAMGYSINIFSLMALAIAIGMVVDNSIVVLENISHHIDNGEKPVQASIFGSSEMGMAITASTLTTVAVFLPMIYMGGMVGILFKQLAVLTTVTIFASLFTSLTLTPMLSSKMLKVKTNKIKKHSRLFNWSEKRFNSMENHYKSMLSWSVNHRWFILTTALIIFVGTLWMGRNIGSDYIPEFDAGDVLASIELEVGSSVQETNRIAKEVEKIMKEEIPDARAIYVISGQTEKGILGSVGFDEGKNKATIGAKLVIPDNRDYTSKEVATKIRKRIAKIPEIVNFRVTGGSLLGSALVGNKKPVEIAIMGNNFEELNKTATLISNQLQKLPYLKNVQNTIDKGNLEFKVNVDRVKASDLGLSSASIALQVRQAIYGSETTEYRENGDKYKIVVRYAPKFRNDINELQKIMLVNSKGQQIPLEQVAEIVQGKGLLQINRESQQRTVYVKAELNKISLGDAVKKIQSFLKTIPTNTDVVIKIGGQYEDQQESFGSLKLIFILGILLVYMVMASQFGSFVDPFIIMFAVPLAIIGVLWAFFITNLTLSVITFIGIIMLLGVVVNNGIVLVDYTNLLRARGYKIKDAILQAGKLRMRPVLMTAFTTILGMFPLAISKGMGSEMWKPLGITVIGGLLIATLITLIFIPVIYLTFHHKQLKKESEEN